MKTKAFRKILGTFAVLALALGVGVAIRSVSAGTETGSGWLWGGSEATDTNGAAVPNNGTIDGDESGFGWISMNDSDVKASCDTDNNTFTDVACGGLNTAATPWRTYGVNIPASGDLSGYAWSEQYGWVSFNGADLADCAPALPRATRTGDALSGGARILAIKDAVAANNAGGFDGCISLSGTATNGSTYGVSVNGSALSGYAWSSDLGWIDMSGATYAEPSTLKICYENCTSGPAVPATAGFAYSEAKNVVACYNAASGCNASDNSGNVTSNPLTSWNESGTNVVSPSIMNVGGVGDTKRWTAGTTPGTETISVSYNSGTSVDFNASVTCSPTTNCDTVRAGVCIGELVPTGTMATGICGSIACGGQEGTRYCDMNWKEVAPGQ